MFMRMMFLKVRSTVPVSDTSMCLFTQRGPLYACILLTAITQNSSPGGIHPYLCLFIS